METQELAKAYEPKGVEDKWYSAWLEMKAFAADPASKKPPYSIVIPPPNITGVLTMGHVLNNTLQDILVRRKHMQGFEVLWLPGTDHAGIATQTVVERMLKKEGKHRDDLGREEFVKRVWEWKDKHGGIIIKQLKKLGCACDWEREVFTMDGLDTRRSDPSRSPVMMEGTRHYCAGGQAEPLPYKTEPRVNYSSVVQKVFVDLYKKGFIYRGLKMVNWCPISRTALSDEEVVMKETDGHLWHFRYPIINPPSPPFEKGGSGGDFIIVATTRPETMLGDEAIAVNPKDKRYKHLVGRKVLLPLQNKPIPIIADEAVELGFGTGAVKVTPAHDPVDYDIGLRHKLPVTVVIGPNGVMTNAAGEKFAELDRFECRRAVVADMEELGLLEKAEPYKHNVGFSQRADVPIEPYLSKQWFLKYPKVKESLKAVEKGAVKFWPGRWTKVYSHWLKGIRDWCISRQLWWGHRIPAWYCVVAKLALPDHVAQDFSPANTGRSKDLRYNSDRTSSATTKCPPIVSIERPAKCPHCGATEFKQENDVLDTWFSSWLWPFATMGWPNKTAELKRFYPTSDLVTGPDIIFFWVARMIMAGFEFMGEKPFSNVYFTGIIRDEQGRKMSKSLGNSPDPLDLIDKYGADGLRFGLMLIAPKGQDILFSEDRVEVGRNFMNKLWNASRFVMMNVMSSPRTRGSPEYTGSPLTTAGMTDLTLADKWILNRLQHTTKNVNTALDHYQFDTAAHTLYQFVWGDFCDWYLELAKTQMAAPATQHILLHTLDNILRMLHPFAPFITEEIWQMVSACHCEGSSPKQSPAGDCFPPNCRRAGANARNDILLHADYPAPSKKIEHAKEANEMQAIMDVISAIRNIRGEHNVAPGKQIEVTLRAHGPDAIKTLEHGRKYISDLARVSELNIVTGGHAPKGCATAVATGIDIFIPLAGMIDLGAEKTRLTKEIARIETYIKSTEGKLSNKNFVERAPRDVVEKERERLITAKAECEKLRHAVEELNSV